MRYENKNKQDKYLNYNPEIIWITERNTRQTIKTPS